MLVSGGRRQTITGRTRRRIVGVTADNQKDRSITPRNTVIDGFLPWIPSQPFTLLYQTRSLPLRALAALGDKGA
jgi:hypothetical protein